MTVLSSKQILEDKKTRDPNAITSLTLTHKALSDVSCLGELRNLERLDLGFNNLTSLEGLKACVNLKWLSVVQNKLESLKGIEGLTKLTVLNAGKNKLSSVDEVKSIVGLRALILNDNEIVSICGLDQMKELNTLVLSRNPIREIGVSLFKVKSITKLSLSNCQLETIGHSLKSCTELKELRLAHNEITALPVELARNTKIQCLDLGNNVIMSWSDLKVLSSLVNLRNLNLQGNPISEKDKLVKEIKKLVPNLQIFNAKPIDKTMKTDRGDTVDEAGFASSNVDNKLVSQKRDQMDQIKSNKDLKYHVVNQSKDMHRDSATNLGQEMELKPKKQKRKKPVAEEIEEANTIIENKEKKKTKQQQESDYDGRKNEETQDGVQKETKHKKKKINAVLEVASEHKEGGIISVEESKKKSRSKPNEVSIIDDSETPLIDLFIAENDESAEDIVEKTERKPYHMNGGAVVTFSKKWKKSKSHSAGPALPLSLVAEVGLGGPSTWND